MDFRRTILKILGLLPLQSSKIWLCGSVPEREAWSHSLVDRDILEFVSVLSSLVFREGGTIVHGSHPSFTPILIRQAEQFACKRSQLQLFLSERWEKDAVLGSGPYTKIIPATYKENEFQLAPSLTYLRKAMVANVNTGIFIGGKLHKNVTGAPTLDEEMNLAETNGVPSFVIGGTNGLSKERINDEFLVRMNSLFPLESLSRISKEESLTILPGQLLSMIKQIGKV